MWLSEIGYLGSPRWQPGTLALSAALILADHQLLCSPHHYSAAVTHLRIATLARLQSACIHRTQDIAVTVILVATGLLMWCLQRVAAGSQHV